MASVLLPKNEEKRLGALMSLHILDTEEEKVYDAITSLASQIMHTPISLISLIDADRNWYKSRVGYTGVETPRALALCAQAILNPTHPMIVNDAASDKRFSSYPSVKDDKPGIRFYYGVPLLVSGNLPVGALCTIDNVPRPNPTKEQMDGIDNLAKLTMSYFELRKFILDVDVEVKMLNTAIPLNSQDTISIYRELNSKCDAVLERIKVRKMLKG